MKKVLKMIGKILGIILLVILVIGIIVYAFVLQYPKLKDDPKIGKWYRVTTSEMKTSEGDKYRALFKKGSENKVLIYFAGGGVSCNEDMAREDTSVDYTLQNQGKDASIYLMNEEIENAVKAIKQKTKELGYHIAGMAPCGVSAGGTLAMNLAYNGNSAIPVKFVFQLAAPTYFAPSEWSLLMKVDRLDSEEEFCKMMTGKELEDYDTEIRNISPACIVNEDSVPSLIGYGLIDHCVPLSQKYYLMEAYDRDNVMYDYIEFPKSNHGMYNDLDKLQEFLDKSLEYAKVYFTD